MTLKHPIAVDGKTISAVTLRRPKARDMIEIADHLPELAKLDLDDATAALAAMNRKVFEAMVAVVGTLADIGDAALELDFEDLLQIATEAFSFMGEAPGDGAAKNGEQPSPKPASSSARQ